MKSIEVKLCRKVIRSHEYRIRRMERLHHEIAHWIMEESTAKNTVHKECCKKMQQMYLKRYQHYLDGNKRKLQNLDLISQG